MAAVRAAGALGPSGSARLGAALGRLIHSPFGFRRALVEQHLRMAFPGHDDAWVRRTARAAYEHLGREAIASIRLARMTREDVLSCTHEVDDSVQQLLNDYRQGKGLVLVSGHIGNHEIGAASLAARGAAVSLVVQRQGNPLFDAALNRARGRLGMEVIDRFEATRQVVRSLRKGNVVGFAADQNAGKTGVFVPFFGRLASTHRGPAFFAIKTGAPMYVGVALRRGSGYEIRAERIDVDRSGDLDEAIYRLTAAFTARIEAIVRSAPEQYLWLHRRWKTRPPEEPARA